MVMKVINSRPWPTRNSSMVSAISILPMTLNICQVTKTVAHAHTFLTNCSFGQLTTASLYLTGNCSIAGSNIVSW